jgi:hypothetical protein
MALVVVVAVLEVLAAGQFLAAVLLVELVLRVLDFRVELTVAAAVVVVKLLYQELFLAALERQV